MDEDVRLRALDPGRDLPLLERLWAAALGSVWPLLPGALDIVRDGVIAEAGGAGTQVGPGPRVGLGTRVGPGTRPGPGTPARPGTAVRLGSRAGAPVAGTPLTRGWA